MVLVLVNMFINRRRKSKCFCEHVLTKIWKKDSHYWFTKMVSSPKMSAFGIRFYCIIQQNTHVGAKLFNRFQFYSG